MASSKKENKQTEGELDIENQFRKSDKNDSDCELEYTFDDIIDRDDQAFEIKSKVFSQQYDPFKEERLDKEFSGEESSAQDVSGEASGEEGGTQEESEEGDDNEKEGNFEEETREEDLDDGEIEEQQIKKDAASDSSDGDNDDEDNIKASVVKEKEMKEKKPAVEVDDAAKQQTGIVGKTRPWKQKANIHSIIKKGRVYVIRRISRRIEQFKGKKGNDKQVAKNERKINRMLSEISTIKDFLVEDLTERILNLLLEKSQLSADLEVWSACLLNRNAVEKLIQKYSDDDTKNEEWGAIKQLSFIRLISNKDVLAKLMLINQGVNVNPSVYKKAPLKHETRITLKEMHEKKAKRKKGQLFVNKVEDKLKMVEEKKATKNKTNGNNAKENMAKIKKTKENDVKEKKLTKNKTTNEDEDEVFAEQGKNPDKPTKPNKYKSRDEVDTKIKSVKKSNMFNYNIENNIKLSAPEIEKQSIDKSSKDTLPVSNETIGFKDADSDKNKETTMQRAAYDSNRNCFSFSKDSFFMGSLYDGDESEGELTDQEFSSPAQPKTYIRKQIKAPLKADSGHTVDAATGDLQIVDAEEKAPRKNRMGQRQRREQQSRKINALTKGIGDASTHNAGGAFTNHRKRDKNQSWDGGKVKSAVKVDQKKIKIDTKDILNLHPSWKAKQEAKSKQSIASFAGTKIVFDD